MQANTKDLMMFLMEQDLNKEWVLEEYRERKKRSLDSNNYFHQLCRKLAQSMTPPISLTKCKNMMIAAYGQPEYIDDVPVTIKSNIPIEKMDEIEYLHTKCVKVTKENGADVFFYRVYRGSHTYDSKEMATLISGLVAECQQCGVETATPEELAHMAQLWEQNREKKHETL